MAGAMSRTGLLIAAGLVAGLWSCGDPSGPEDPWDGWNWGLNATGLVVAPGDTFSLYVFAQRGGDGGRWYQYPVVDWYAEAWPADRPVQVWTSDSTVLTLAQPDPMVFSGVGEGEATIWVESAGRRDSARVLVDPAPDGLAGVVSVTLGNDHTCATNGNAVAYCWGSNSGGGLGRAAHRRWTVEASPTRVVGGVRFTRLAAGGRHTCGLTEDARAYCWGDSFFGQTGTGLRWEEGMDSLAEVAVLQPTLVGTEQRFEAIDAGPTNTCAIALSGAVWCWGGNLGGALGRGFVTDAEAAVPGRVLGEHTFAEVSVGGTHTCALTETGAAYCWGQNQRGAVGVPPTDGLYEPTAVNTELRFSSIDVRDESSCALTPEGQLYCWGHGWSDTPRSIGGVPVLAKIAVANDEVCGLDQSGNAYCWSLFDGPTTGRAVNSAGAFATIEAGSKHFCGISLDGFLYCWGSNDQGEVGDGTLERLKPEPVRVVAW